MALPMTGPVSRWMVLGQLIAGADAAEFVPAARATNQDLAGLPGFLARELSMTAGGEWADLVHWRSRGEALAAMAQFPTLPSAQAFGALMDGETCVCCIWNVFWLVAGSL